MGDSLWLVDSKNRRKRAEKSICLICNNSFLKRLNVETKYCSKECLYKSRQTKVLVKCAACEKEFYKKPSSLKQSRSGLFFCTRACKDKSQRIGGIEEIMPDHYNKCNPNSIKRSVVDYDINIEKEDVENSVSYTCPELIKEWHPILNGKLTPFNISLYSSYKAWWICSEKSHEWQTSVSNRTFNKRGCPYCSNRFACKDNCLATTHPELAKEWHPTKNELTPFDITAGSGKIIWWKCPFAEDHEWKTSAGNRKQGNNNCPFCSNKKLARSNSLGVLNPELAKEFHPTKNKNLTVFDIVNGGSEKCWWQCENNNNHSWKASVYTRIQGYSCPLCKSSRGEKRVLEYLIQNKIQFQSQFTFESMKRKLRYDFGVISKRACVIEYNGGQHYYPMNFGSKKEGYDLKKLQENQERDKIKIDYCRDNNIELLIIPYWDFYRIEEILDCWFNNEEVVFSEEPEIVKKYKIGVFNE